MRVARLLVFAAIVLLPRSLPAQASSGEIAAGQELIYSGRFGAARIYFADLARAWPRDAAGPTLAAAALVWWAEARQEPDFEADSIEALLDEAVARAQTAVDSAPDGIVRATALFWLGTARGYRARQADLHGGTWRAGREAKAMRDALSASWALDSTRVDCLLGIGTYDYALARAGALARLVARVIGLGSGDAERGLAMMRRVVDEGLLLRIDARWVYATSLLREGERDPALREEAVRRLVELAAKFPDNPVFRRAVPARSAP